MDIFRRPSRSMQSHVSRDGRSIPLIHHPSSTSPTQDSEDDKGGTQPRRRIALACSRCRKRKIKCSGDLGHGLGCQNCKNAGSDPGTCQFLRVNSTTTFYSHPNPVTWPYASSSTLAPASGVVRGGGNVGQYSSTDAGMLSSSSSGSFPALNQFSRVPSFGNASGAPFSTMPSRQSYSSSCGNTYCEDILDQYSLSAQQYLFPAQTSQSLSPGYTGQQWRPIPPHPVSRASLEITPDSALRYGASTYSYMNSATASVPSMTTDGSPAFPGLSSLGKSLPTHSAITHSANRTLPNPASNKPSIESITNSNQGSTADFSTPFGVPQNLGYKSDLSWGNEHVTAGGSQGPMSSVSPGNIIASEGGSKPSSSPRISQDTTGFGLLPLSNTPLTLTTSHSSEYIPAILPESTNSTDAQLMLGDNGFQSGLPSDTMLSSHGSTSLYSYCMGNGGRNGSITDSMASEGTLANGQVYKCLRQSDSQPLPSFDPLRKGSIEITTPAHRAPISSASTRAVLVTSGMSITW